MIHVKEILLCSGLELQTMSNNEDICFSDNGDFFMHRAIELARGGEGWTNPNPLVGAVIVRDGVVLGEGFHKKYGGLHAEREALADCIRRGNDARGADIYVTLEPCAHFGKQPPCCHALAEAGIARVFVGSRDPNPLVHGKGNAYLREHGIEVYEDFLREECDKLNQIFFHYITEKKPFVALKYAVTADGKIATRIGKSKWITGEKSRAYVQQLRNRYAAILCGIGTVLADDPMLNCRMEGGNNPIRIVMDSKLKIPMESRLVQTAREIPLLIVCSADAEASSEFAEKKDELEHAGAEILVLGTDSRRKPDINLLLNELGNRGIDSLLVEGGGTVNYSFLETGVVDCVYEFVAPKIFGGGPLAKDPVAGEGVELPSEAFEFSLNEVRRFDDDVLLEYISKNRRKECSQES